MPVSGQNASAIPLPPALPSQRLSQGRGVEVPAHIYQAVADASAKVGVSFAYLMDKAGTESSFNPDAKARTSSASGLFQFIERTWLDMVDRHGAKYGLSEYADAINKRSDGTPVVADRTLRKEILELRKDPKIAALMAAEYAGENKKTLERNLGREVGDTELYLAHFLGAGGATRFLKAMDRNPSASAASLLPEAAQSNRGVFYSRNTGRALTLAQIYDRFDNKFDSGVTYVADAPIEVPETDFMSAMLDPKDAGLEDVLLADYRPQPGAISGADRPFLTTYLLSALEAPGEAEQALNAVNPGSLYQAAAREVPKPAFVGFV